MLIARSVIRGIPTGCYALMLAASLHPVPHNPKVAGSNPAPATNAKARFPRKMARGRAFTFWRQDRAADHRLTKNLRRRGVERAFRNRASADGKRVDGALKEAGHQVRVHLRRNGGIAVPEHVLHLPQRASVREDERRRRVAQVVEAKAARKRLAPPFQRRPARPKSLNNLRGFLHSAFNAADDAGMFNGPNPIAKVKRRKVPERAPMFLEAEERTGSCRSTR